MSKFEHILASNGRALTARRKSGMKGGRARILLLTLTILLIAFVVLTQPQVRSAVGPVMGFIPGF